MESSILSQLSSRFKISSVLLSSLSPSCCLSNSGSSPECSLKIIPLIHSKFYIHLFSVLIMFIFIISYSYLSFLPTIHLSPFPIIQVIQNGRDLGAAVLGLHCSVCVLSLGCGMCDFSSSQPDDWVPCRLAGGFLTTGPLGQSLKCQMLKSLQYFNF